MWSYSYTKPKLSLSTWGEAIVATAWGDVPKLAELLAGEDDDGRGVDLRTFRTSWDDVDYLWRARKVSIDPHCTLIELALARDHSDVVSLLLADDGPVCVTSTPSAPRAPPDAPQVAMGAVFDWDEAEDYDAMLERAGGRFDVLLLCDVLYEARQARPVANMASRLLEPGGFLLLADPPNRAPQNRAACLEAMYATGHFTCVHSNTLTTRDVDEAAHRWGARDDTTSVPIVLEHLVMTTHDAL